MVSVISENDSKENYEAKIAELEWNIKSLQDHLNNYPTAAQAKQINSFIAYYNNAINTYKNAISELEKTRNDQLRGSAIKEQAMKWYVQGFGSHRWATAAETLKSVADINAQWAAERANINANAWANLANAYSNLSNIMQNAWQTLANYQLSNMASSWSSWWSGRSSSSNKYNDILQSLLDANKNNETNETNNELENADLETRRTFKSRLKKFLTKMSDKL